MRGRRLKTPAQLLEQSSAGHIDILQGSEQDLPLTLVLSWHLDSMQATLISAFRAPDRVLALVEAGGFNHSFDLAQRFAHGLRGTCTEFPDSSHAVVVVALGRKLLTAELEGRDLPDL